MSTIDVILFYSRASVHSRNLIKLLAELGIRLKSVSLDTKESRNLVARNHGFQITKVPTIMVVKDDGVVEAYVGNDAVSWVYSVAQQPHGSTPPDSKSAPAKKKPPHTASILQPPEDDEEILDDEDGEEEIVETEEKPRVPSYKPRTSSSASMADILEEAKRMAKQRDEQLFIPGMREPV